MNPLGGFFSVCLLALIFTGFANAATEERGNLVLENIPEIPASVASRVLQYRAARSSNFQSWSTNSRSMLISTRFGETSQLHFVEKALGAREQITFYSEPVAGGRIRPGTNDIVFAKDAGGTEDYHIFYYEAATGRTRQITTGGGRNTGGAFTRDGNTLAWSHSAPGARDRNIMLATGPDFGDGRIIFAAGGSWSPSDFSHDGKRLILHHYVSGTIMSLHILDIETGETVEVNPSPEPHAYSGAEFSPDGKELYFLTDEASEFRNLYRYDIASGKKTNLTPDINWEISSFDLSNNGKNVALVYNQNGASRFQIIRTRDDKILSVPDLPPGVVSSFGFSPDSRRVAYTFSSSKNPGNIFVFTPGRITTTPWTRSEVGGLDTASFSEPHFFTYPTFDEEGGARRQIPAYVYKPKGEGPHPVVIYIHGGPASQFKPRFYTTFQYWLNEMGIALVAPNVRGSSGYGKTYRELDNHYKREDSVKDIGALLDWIETQDDLDASRIVVYGGSYGGYMALASMMHYNDRLAGGVDSVGISNFVTFLENTRPYRRDLRRVEYGDERDPEMRAFLERISPANHADKITKPLFVIQGKNDPRVPYTEAIQMLDQMRAAGSDPWFLMATDEGHGFRKKSNNDFRAGAIVMFLDEVMFKGEKE